MKIKWLSETASYDGTQLSPLTNYLRHGLLGDSMVAWVGPCEIPLDFMVDGEDLRARASIQGSQMLHFIMEVYDRDLFAGVACQRLMASLAKDLLLESSVKTQGLRRDGDDLYWQDRKLSISIATRSVNSTLMHFAMNVSNEGTPVATCALADDFGLDPEAVAVELLKRFQHEYLSIMDATRKVKCVESWS